MLSIGLLFFLAFLAIGAVYLPYFIPAFSLLLVLYILIFIRPLTGLTLVILLTFLSNIVIIINSPVRTANEIVPFAIIPILLVYISLLPKMVPNLKYTDKYEKTIMLLLLFLFWWAMISFFWTRDACHGINVLLTFLASILVVQIILFLIEDKSVLYKMLNLMSILGVVLGILLVVSKSYPESKQVEIFSHVTFSISLLTDHDRPGGFAPPDLAAAVMNIFVFINIALMFRANRLKKVVLGIMTLFLVYCNFLTSSKAGAGSLFFGLVVLLFTMPLFRKYLIRLSVALSFFMLLMGTLGGKILLKRIKLAMESNTAQAGLSERLEWWKTGFDRLLDTGGTGLGVGGFLKYIDPVPGAHSVYFSLLFDLGVIGLSIFIIIIIVLINYIRSTLQVCKDKEMIFFIYCFIANLVAFSIQSLVEGDFQQIFFWLLVGLVVVVLKVAAKTKESGFKIIPTKHADVIYV